MMIYISHEADESVVLFYKLITKRNQILIDYKEKIQRGKILLSCTVQRY